MSDEGRRTGREELRPLGKGTQSRERLLDAAIACFARDGFEGASVRQIAHEAGVTFQLIRHHFGSKEDLWIAAAFHLWDRAQELLAEAMTPPPEDAVDPRRAFRHFVRVILEYNARTPNLRRMFAHEVFADTERYRRILRPYMRRFSKQQLEWMRGYARSGVLTRFSPEEALLIFRSLVAGNSLLHDEFEWLLGRPVSSKTALDYQADLLVGLLLDGRGPATAVAAGANEDETPRQARAASR